MGEIVPEKLETRKEWFQRSTYERLAPYNAMVSDWSSRVEDAQVIDNVLNGYIDFSTTAVVNGRGLPKLSGLTTGSSVRMGDSDPDVMRFEVETGKPAFLVISSNYYPGWTAEVDGKPTPIYRTNFVTTGVLVPQGRSTVVLSFVTPGLRSGMLVSLSTIGLSIVVLFYYRRRATGKKHKY